MRMSDEELAKIDALSDQYGPIITRNSILRQRVFGKSTVNEPLPLAVYGVRDSKEFARKPSVLALVPRIYDKDEDEDEDEGATFLFPGLVGS
jgi:hypothetical protein